VGRDDQVVVSYIGFLGNQLPATQGEFDANESFAFAIGSPKIIKGYSAGVDGMKVEGSRVVIVPPDLGYGANGVRGTIPPNAVLAFLITLKSATIKAKPAPASEPAPQQRPAQQALAATAPTPRPQAVQAATPSAPIARPQAPVPQQQAPAPEPAVRRGLWDGEEDEDEAPSGDIRVVAAIDEGELLQRVDALTDVVRGRLEALALDASQLMDPTEALAEVRVLAGEVEDKERQLREQQQMIDELRRTKQNSRLRAELDIAETELQSLRALLKGGRDFRRENDDLRAELRHVKDVEITEIEREIRELRGQLEKEREVSRQTSSANMRELFFKFMGAAIQGLNKRLAGQVQIQTANLTGVVYDVFS
jgi:hypothetical protein